jgi:hypothetical protein
MHGARQTLTCAPVLLGPWIWHADDFGLPMTAPEQEAEVAGIKMCAPGVGRARREKRRMTCQLTWACRTEFLFG